MQYNECVKDKDKKVITKRPVGAIIQDLIF